MRVTRHYRQKQFCILIGSICAVLALWSIQSYALSDDEIKNVLLKNSSYFVVNNIITDGLRTVGWGIVKLLVYLCNAAMVLYQKSFGMIDFTTWSVTEKWLKTFTLVVRAIMALGLTYMGITLIVGRKEKPPIFKAVLLFGFTTVALVEGMTMLNQGIKAMCLEIVGNPTSNAADIVSQNMVDLIYIDNKKGIATFDSTNTDYMASCHYSIKNLDAIDITEVINFKSKLLSEASRGQDGVFGKMLMFQGNLSDDQNNIGNWTLADIYAGFGWNDGEDADFLNTFYYRYHIDFMSTYISLIATTLVYFFMAYKVVRILYELSFKRIYGVLKAADLNGVEKTKKLLGSIKDAYIVLGLTAILIKLYQLAQLYIAFVFANDRGVGNIFLLFIAIAVIDGPNIVQQLTGIDAGLTSIAGNTIVATQLAMAAARSAGNVGSRVAHGAEKTVDKAKDKVGKMAAQAKDTIGNMNPDAENGTPPKDIGNNLSADSSNTNATDVAENMNSNVNSHASENTNEQMRQDLNQKQPESAGNHSDQAKASLQKTSSDHTKNASDSVNAGLSQKEKNISGEGSSAKENLMPKQTDPLTHSTMDKNKSAPETFADLNKSLMPGKSESLGTKDSVTSGASSNMPTMDMMDSKATLSESGEKLASTPEKISNMGEMKNEQKS